MTSKCWMFILLAVSASVSANVFSYNRLRDKYNPRKLENIGVTDITGIFGILRGDDVELKRVRRSEPDRDEPDQFHGEYALQGQYGDVENTGEKRKTATGSVPERFTVNRDTFGPADDVRDGNANKGSKQVLMEPNGPGGHEVLLAFGKDDTQFGQNDDTVVTKFGDGYIVAIDKGPEGGKPKRSVAGTGPPERQCFYVEWKSSTILYVYPPKDAVNGKCSYDLWPSEDFDDIQFRDGGKQVHVNSDVQLFQS